MNAPPDDFPEESGTDGESGLWFVFPLPEATVRTWGDAAGFERVYVDEELVSAHWSYLLRSVHEFRIGEDSYQIVCETHLRGGGALDCSLVKNGDVQQMQQARYREPEDAAGCAWRIVLVGGLLGLVVGTFEWPVWAPVVVCAVILGWRRQRRAILRRVVIEPAP